MKIRKIAFDGVRGLPDREFDLTDPKTNRAARLVVVTGGRASGKTSFLDGIVMAKEQIAPYAAAPAAVDVVRPGEDAAKIRTTWELSPHERDFHGAAETEIGSEALFGEHLPFAPDQNPALVAVLSAYDAEEDIGKVEYFHSARRLPLGSTIDLSQGAASQSDKMMRLEKSDAKYAGLVRFVVEAGLGLDVGANGTPKPPGRVKSVFETLCDSKRLGGLYRAEGNVLPGFFDREGRAYGLAQLSDSELEAFLFAVTFVRSGLVASRAGSLVLIDTPEKHMGAEDVPRFIEGLLRLGEENQLVVATRSRELAAAAPRVIQLGAG